MPCVFYTYCFPIPLSSIAFQPIVFKSKTNIPILVLPKAKHPEIDINHAAWDMTNCTAYKPQLSILRNGMFNDK
jgi:hypothetical protein